MERCPKCGYTKIDMGHIGISRDSNTDNIYYKSSRQEWYSPASFITSYACFNCGYTELYSDIEKLKKIIR